MRSLFHLALFAPAVLATSCASLLPWECLGGCSDLAISPHVVRPISARGGRMMVRLSEGEVLHLAKGDEIDVALYVHGNQTLNDVMWSADRLDVLHLIPLRGNCFENAKCARLQAVSDGEAAVSARTKARYASTHSRNPQQLEALLRVSVAPDSDWR